MVIRRMPWLLPFLASAVGLAACAAPAGDDAEEQTSNVTGGSGSVESAVVYFFAEGGDAAPRCAGALLDDKIAVTAKACAAEGLLAGRAADKDGRGKRAKVTSVRVPDDADADIALVELDAPLGGTRAVLTHMPLRRGYAVNGVAAVDGSGLFAPDEGEASSVKGAMIEETEAHGRIVPDAGSEICSGDLGAPVCSSTGAKIAGYNISGTCGLSGIVVGPADSAPQSVATGGADEGPSKGCSGKAWKVARLGRYAEFLKQHAPKAFEPLRIDKPILRNIAYVPAGLWGYKTGGQVAACAIETVQLDAVAPGAASAPVTAKVSFAGMEKLAAPYGRFGIAKKSEPTKMRWLPARLLDPVAARGDAFEARFEGVVSAAEAGEYVVAFRASANGGESWTSCDTTGIDDGFDVGKALSLRVGDAPPPPEGEGPPPTTPQDVPPAPAGEEGAGSEYSDPPPDQRSEPGDYSVGEEDDGIIGSNKSEASGGCSAAPSRTPAGALPLAGVIVGLVALLRRRRGA